MKHCFECLIQLLKLIVKSGENKGIRDFSEIIREERGRGADFKLSVENDVTLPSDGNEIS